MINKNTIIYVLCPAYKKTGGPELLHQLVKELNENNIRSYITYFDIKKNDKNYTADDFKKYISDYKTLEDIEDKKDNIIITPEKISAIKFTRKKKFARKIIWWLSVDNFKIHYGLINSLKAHGPITMPILCLKSEILFSFSYIYDFDYHLVQSYYAIDFLKNNNVKNIIYLSDYVSDEYLSIKENWGKKEDIIVYNPTKGQKFTDKIIKRAPNLKFIPIKNLTTNQVKELLLKAKVYIDFGYHPGKDRIPREAALCGCCIITNNKGSARYFNDVPINNEFKFIDSDDNIEDIISKITYCIKNYDDEIVKFKEYRQYIQNEKNQFKLDVKNIFLKSQ